MEYSVLDSDEYGDSRGGDFDDLDTPDENLGSDINFDEELFLKMICNYPVIYNTQNKGYANRNFKENAFLNISRSVNLDVESCKKKWKALREKYYREKNKIDLLTRSGAGATQFQPWPYMSYFQFMFDKVTPRNTHSSPMLEINIPESVDCATDSMELLSPTSSTISLQANKKTPKKPPHATKCSSQSVETPTSAGLIKRTVLKRKQDDDPLIGLLGKISNSIEEASTPIEIQKDKISDFSNYLVAELRELPIDSREEFMDQTVIRLLQVKRKFRSDH